MTFVVTESCVKLKYTRYVDAYPTDAIREGPDFLAIEPEDCIDCVLCVAVRLVDRILGERDVPQDQARLIALNLELTRSWKSTIEMKAAPSDANEWAKIKDEFHLLTRERIVL